MLWLPALGFFLSLGMQALDGVLLPMEMATAGLCFTFLLAIEGMKEQAKIEVSNDRIYFWGVSEEEIEELLKG